MGNETEVPEGPSDSYLFSRMLRLADLSAPHPFLRLVGSRRAAIDTEVELTDAGAEALKGGLNFVALNGIDDWVGGVHLDSSAGNFWYRDGETLVGGLD